MEGVGRSLGGGVGRRNWEEMREVGRSWEEFGRRSWEEELGGGVERMRSWEEELGGVERSWKELGGVWEEELGGGVGRMGSWEEELGGVEGSWEKLRGVGGSWKEEGIRKGTVDNQTGA